MIPTNCFFCQSKLKIHSYPEHEKYSCNGFSRYIDHSLYYVFNNNKYCNGHFSNEIIIIDSIPSICEVFYNFGQSYHKAFESSPQFIDENFYQKCLKRIKMLKNFL